MMRFILLCCVMWALVACGANNAAVALPTALAVTRAADATPVVVSDGGDVLPTLEISQGANTERIDCGDLNVAGKPLRAANVTDAQLAAACFSRAVEACQAAVLTIRESDSGFIRQFFVTGTRGSCVIRQAMQPDANSAPAVVDCARAQIDTQQLKISACSHLGDFMLSLEK